MAGIIRTEPFHIQAYKHIQANLIANSYAPGERLTETALATKLGISRGPVREAIRMLLHDGLLVQEGVHVYVYNPSFDDVRDLFLCRERLEPLGAGLAAEKITVKGRKRLIQIIEETEIALKNRQPNNKIAALNAAFHDHIVFSSRNKQLIQFMELIRAKNGYMRNVLLGEFKRKDAFINEHRIIAEKIIEGNKLEAESTMKQHIRADFSAWEQIFITRKEEEDSE